MAFVGMAQPSVPPAKSRRPVPALAAYLSNPGVLCVLADLSQAVLSVEPVRAIARNSLAGSRRWNAPRDAPHSRVLERFANFASLFRCDAALREIVHDLIDVPLDGAGRVWLFLVGHRASSSPSSVDSPQSGLRPALQGYHFDFGRSSAPFRRRSQPARSCAPMPRLASISYRLPVRSCDRSLAP
jgi:hypothetical protein